MGTSVAMIEQHYSHLDVVKAMAQLRGEESRQLLDLALDEDDKKRYAYTEEKNISNKLIKSNRIK
jgi:hypothetical protein